MDNFENIIWIYVSIVIIYLLLKIEIYLFAEAVIWLAWKEDCNLSFISIFFCFFFVKKKNFLTVWTEEWKVSKRSECLLPLSQPALQTMNIHTLSVLYTCAHTHTHSCISEHPLPWLRPFTSGSVSSTKRTKRKVQALWPPNYSIMSLLDQQSSRWEVVHIRHIRKTNHMQNSQQKGSKFIPLNCLISEPANEFLQS